MFENVAFGKIPEHIKLKQMYLYYNEQKFELVADHEVFVKQITSMIVFEKPIIKISKEMLLRLEYIKKLKNNKQSSEII
ncbi:hypothetical protein [Bartonella sp. CL34QHWL]|uniref:hypothetical protein n=1 Tax=Bartonella sp. CL34QHWL TaxID=3243526 RepID=UPI0035D0B4B5